MDFYDVLPLRGTARCACTMLLYGTVQDPFRHGIIPACADRTAALITSNKKEIRHLTLRRAPVELGSCILRSKLRAAQPNPTKSALLHAQICEWNLATKARKKTDFAQEINNASYLDHQMST